MKAKCYTSTMNAKEYSEIIGVSRKFLDNYHKYINQTEKKHGERWTLEDWESHKKDILEKWKLGNHKKNDKGEPVIILNSLIYENDRSYPKRYYLGTFSETAKDSLREYVRNKLFIKPAYWNKIKQEISILDYYIKSLGTDLERQEDIDFIIQEISKTNCLKNDFELQFTKRRTDTIRPAKISLDEIQKYNENYDKKSYCNEKDERVIYTRKIVELKEKNGSLDDVIDRIAPKRKIEKDSEKELEKLDLTYRYHDFNRIVETMSAVVYSETVAEEIERVLQNRRTEIAKSKDLSEYAEEIENIDYIHSRLRSIPIENALEEYLRERDEKTRAIEKAMEEYISNMDS